MIRKYEHINDDLGYDHKSCLEQLFNELIILITSFLNIDGIMSLLCTSKTLHRKSVTVFKQELDNYMWIILDNYIHYYLVHCICKPNSTNYRPQYMNHKSLYWQYMCILKSSRRAALDQVKMFIRELYEIYVMQMNGVFSRQDDVYQHSYSKLRGKFVKRYISRFIFHFNYDPTISIKTMDAFSKRFNDNFSIEKSRIFSVHPDLEFVDIDKQYFCKTIAIKIEGMDYESFYVILKYYHNFSKNTLSNLFKMISYEEHYCLLLSKDAIKILEYDDVSIHFFE